MKQFLGKAALLSGMLLASTTMLAAQEITFWTLNFSSEAANNAIDEVAAEFSDAHPGVTIKVITRGTDEHKTALRVAAGSDSGPDIYFHWAGLGLGGEYVLAGMSQPMDKYYKEFKWNDRLLGSAIAFSEQFGDAKHGAPATFKGEVIYYNKKLFEKAGIAQEPQTYKELLEAAEKLSSAGIPPFTFGGTVNWHVMRLMDALLETTCGKEKHDALKAMQLNWKDEPCATASFEAQKLWTDKYFLKPFMGIDHNQAFQLFAADRAAMMLEGSWLVNRVKEAGVMDNVGIFPFPTGTDRLYGFGEMNYISSKSKNPDVAAEFLNYWLSDEVQQRLVGRLGGTSVNKNVVYPDNLSDMHKEWLEIFAKYKGIFVNGDQAFPLDVTTEYFRVINEVSSGNMEPADAAAAMQTFIDNRS